MTTEIKVENDEKKIPLQEAFHALKKRVKALRKSRINAAKRLRSRHEFFEKVTNIYSIVVLVLSVWFIGASDDGLIVAKSLLMLSLSMTFLSMFLNSKNYKERAGMFETNYQNLDILTNKIERYGASGKLITEEELKNFHREYEKLIMEKENHKDIDFYTSTTDLRSLHSKEIWIHEIVSKFKNACIILYPFIIALLIFVSSKFFEWLK
jgi:hypothetical protein